ncbi:MAG: CAP domain-containing protein [archaeon]
MSDKQVLFLKYVAEASKSRGLEPPRVEFWDGDCPFGGNDQVAHIHVHLGIICIRKAILQRLSNEEIRETAIHETMHLFENNHSTAFYNEMETTSQRIWRPPGGVYHGGGNVKEEKTKPEHPYRDDRSKCNDARCRKRRVLHQCPYCKLFFCEEHVRAKHPYLRNFNNPSAIDRLNDEDKGGHPCTEYALKLQIEKKEESERYSKNLGKILDNSKRQITIDLTKYPTIERESNPVKQGKVKKSELITYDKKPVAILKKCYSCNKDLKKHSYECRYCHEHFCEEHKRAEEHRCSKLYGIPEKITESYQLKTECESEKGVQANQEQTASEPIKKRSRNYTNLLKAALTSLIIVLVLIAVAVLIVFLMQPKTQDAVSTNDTKQEPTRTTITEAVPVEISLREYLVNWAEYDKKEVILKGYLQNDIEGTKQGGVYVDSVVDDVGRSIPLRMLTQEQKALFVKKGTTKDVYKITGVLSRKYPGVELTVSEIVPAEKQTTTVTREITLIPKEESVEEVLKDEPKKGNFSLDKVWIGISSFFDSISTGIKEMKLKEKGSKIADDVSEIAKSGSEAVKTTFEEITAPPQPVSNRTKEVEQAIFEYTNAERKSQGLRALTWDDKLADIARAHSLDMVENDFFAHTNLKGEDPSARAARAGYNAYKSLGGGSYSIGVAENIGKMPTGNVQGIGYVSSNPDSIARAQVSSWMDSPGHRSNILNPQYDVIGVGVAYDGLYYVATQDFK